MKPSRPTFVVLSHLLVALCLLAAPVVARAAEVIITVTDYSFTPSDVTIGVGDTVKWQWLDGVHTTTSGAGDSDPNAGGLWDQMLFAGQESLSHTFTAPGEYPFFCRFHEALNMKGSVSVNRIRNWAAREKSPGDDHGPASWGMVKGLFR